jgi:hypothetical protein
MTAALENVLSAGPINGRSFAARALNRRAGSEAHNGQHKPTLRCRYALATVQMK